MTDFTEQLRFNYFWTLTKNQFPLILRKVILGPKFIEKDVNVFQLSQMIPECNIHKGHEIECKMSEIDNYR